MRKTPGGKILKSTLALNTMIKELLGADSLAYLAIYDVLAKIENCHNLFHAVSSTINESSKDLEDFFYYLIDDFPGDAQRCYATNELTPQLKEELSKFFASIAPAPMPNTPRTNIMFD